MPPALLVHPHFLITLINPGWQLLQAIGANAAGFLD
jgi:hypothetical protein